MRVVWSAPARSDLADIYHFVASHNPEAAAKLRNRIGDAVMKMQALPEMGRPGRVDKTRELVITGTPYIVPYCVVGQTIRLLRVYHSARMWPEGFST